MEGGRIFFRGAELPEGLVEGQMYFVVNRTDGAFQVEASPGSGIVDLTTNGNGALTITLRPGAKVIGDVNAGKRPAAFVWFHEVVEWVQANIIF